MAQYSFEEMGSMAQTYAAMILVRAGLEGEKYSLEEKRQIAKTATEDAIPSYKLLPAEFIEATSNGERQRPIDIGELEKSCKEIMSWM